MPEVVADYAENGDLVRLKSIYNSLLKGYNEDVKSMHRPSCRRMSSGIYCGRAGTRQDRLLNWEILESQAITKGSA